MTRQLKNIDANLRKSPVTQSQNQSKREKFNLLDIAVHNINGIKLNKNILSALLDELTECDVVCLNETNLTQREGKFLSNDFTANWKSYWSKAPPGHKKKGFGVAIFIKNEWARYIKKINYVSPYVMTLQLAFRQCNITITNIYRCPNDDLNSKQILYYINSELLKGYRDDGKNHHVIVGDFNATMDSALDKHMASQNAMAPKTTNNQACQNKIGPRIVQWLKGKGFVDTFRECYPLNRAYTWTNGTTSTRIDYIWLSASWSQLLLDASILDSQLITDSDH